MKLFQITCYPCAMGFHYECDPEDCCCEGTGMAPLGLVPAQREQKEDSEITDAKSTGRKRAVQVKPITEGMACEWAKLKRAGGGIFPIVGCFDGIATNVHHGPDKCTLNNDLSNLHRICTNCHNRWHAINDPTYGPDPITSTWLPLPENGISSVHDSTLEATPADMVASEAWWAIPKAQRPLYPFTLEEVNNVGTNA